MKYTCFNCKSEVAVERDERASGCPCCGYMKDINYYFIPTPFPCYPYPWAPSPNDNSNEWEITWDRNTGGTSTYKPPSKAITYIS